MSIPDFQQWLRNDVHDWLSRPYSMFGWRLSGARREPSCVYHAGLDFLTFHCMYLEPALGFLIDGEKPVATGRQWTPGELSGSYRTGSIELRLHVTMPDPSSLLVKVVIRNVSSQRSSFHLTAYGEADRCVDPEDSVDIDIKGSGYGKIFLHARSKRYGARQVLAECFADTADSHRGGLSSYSKFRVLKWHHALTAASLSLHLPTGGAPDDTPAQWRQVWNISLAPQESQELVFAAAAAYQARSMPDQEVKDQLVEQAACISQMDYQQALAATSQFWQEKLQAVLPPPADLDEPLRQMYYRAWTCVWQLVTPGFDTGRIDGHRFPEACVLVTKADHRAVFPADWETGLGSLLLAQVDPPLAAKVFDSQMAAVEPDGTVPENLVNAKENMLPFITTYQQWQIYLRTHDKKWLAQHYDAQKRSIWAHYRNPNFKRRGMPTFRNLVYVHIGFIYLLKIAEELGLSDIEVQHCRWLVDETQQVVQNFWDPQQKCFVDTFQDRGTPEEQGFGKESSVQSMVVLFAGATAEQISCLLSDLRQKYLVGEYGIRECGTMGGSAPDAATLSETDLGKINTYKHSNFMYFIPGLAKADPQLCRQVCWRTIRGIALNGDFHEQMRCNMDRRAFGPMAVFGAYGYIQCVQTLGRLGLQG